MGHVSHLANITAQDWLVFHFIQHSLSWVQPYNRFHEATKVGIECYQSARA